ncbi:cytochrome C oxidase subunit I [Kitasatospora aureofaciens]|uniref:cytochrome C oxidase subunit I n=1 Tax=Kitasatospora aureofaciens TaxID=1894 RepID=UPI001C44A1F1|nr:cytochrome C oxidase subunit I [Kitasatospora aureofaciens]MBV6700499.1 cytochrome C oxidase subunit I [Kitasatospora aureofaciens]
MGGRQRPPRARTSRRNGAPDGVGGWVNTRVEIARLEGFLAWEAEVAAAERDARAFAGQFSWLPAAERESLERAYAADRLRYAEEVVDRAVERCRRLAARYRSECRRICARWAALCLSVTLAAALFAVVPALLRG